MVKRDPDDLITATSKNLKKENTQVMRITLKRGGQHLKLFAKAHSRISRRDLKKKIRQQSNQNQNQVCPLYVRYKEGVGQKETKQNKGQRIRLNCQIKKNKGNDFISSLLGVFRVNFFKKKEQEGKKNKLGPTKPDLNSKSSAKRIAKNKKNKQRRTKRIEIRRQKSQQIKRQKRLKKQTNQNTATFVN